MTRTPPTPSASQEARAEAVLNATIKRINDAADAADDDSDVSMWPEHRACAIAAMLTFAEQPLPAGDVVGLADLEALVAVCEAEFTSDLTETDGDPDDGPWRDDDSEAVSHGLADDGHTLVPGNITFGHIRRARAALSTLPQVEPNTGWREAVRNAYVQGATDVHSEWMRERVLPTTEHPEFGEAADDYAASVELAHPDHSTVEGKGR